MQSGNIYGDTGYTIYFDKKELDSSEKIDKQIYKLEGLDKPKNNLYLELVEKRNYIHKTIDLIVNHHDFGN